MNSLKLIELQQSGWVMSSTTVTVVATARRFSATVGGCLSPPLALLAPFTLQIMDDMQTHPMVIRPRGGRLIIRSAASRLHTDSDSAGPLGVEIF